MHVNFTRKRVIFARLRVDFFDTHAFFFLNGIYDCGGSLDFDFLVLFIFRYTH
jgi:hypothetical protein